MFAEERQEKIFELICREQSVKVTELSELFDTSVVTIRRDLDVLQQQNKVLRTHGGAILPYSVGKAIQAQDLMTKNVAEKQMIARRAYARVADYDTILLDSSSTVFELCRLLLAQKKKRLRIITTSLQAIQLLSDCEGYSLMIVGGEFNRFHQTVEGYSASRFIREIRVDKCFIGINGIDESFGFSTPRYEDAEIKSRMIASSVESYILADHTKIGRVYLTSVDACNFLITDRKVAGFDYDAIDEDLTVIFAEGDHE